MGLKLSDSTALRPHPKEIMKRGNIVQGVHSKRLYLVAYLPGDVEHQVWLVNLQNGMIESLNLSPSEAYIPYTLVPSGTEFTVA